MIAPLLLSLLRDPEIRAEIVAILRDAAPEPPPLESVHMTRAEYARRSRVSEATVSRWVAAGMPTMPVGTTYRIDPLLADEWRRTRTPKPTTPATKKSAEIDVSDVLGRAGIRRAG